MTEAKKRNTTKTRKSGAKWTPYYDRRLKELYAQRDMTVAEIAEKLGRPKTAVYKRAQVIGARRHAPAMKPKRAAKKRRSWLDWLLGA